MSTDPVFYDFLGHRHPSDRSQPAPPFLNTELSLGNPAYGQPEPPYAAARAASRQANLVALGLLERQREREDQERRATLEAQRIAGMRMDRHRTNHVPFPTFFKNGPDLGPTRFLPAPSNPCLSFFSPAEKGFSLLGSGSRSIPENREPIVVDDSPKRPAIEIQGYTNKKLKAPVVQSEEKFIMAQPMPTAIAEGSGSGSGSSGTSNNNVLVKGFLRRDDAGDHRIVCTCHGYAHSPDQFISHARGVCNTNAGSDTNCFVTVSLTGAGRE